MVQLNEADLNKVLEVLSDWERILQAENIDLETLSDGSFQSVEEVRS